MPRTQFFPNSRSIISHEFPLLRWLYSYTSQYSEGTVLDVTIASNLSGAKSTSKKIVYIYNNNLCTE